METSALPTWTLSAQLDADVVEFFLGDGRRLAWRARRPAALVQAAREACTPIAAERLLGSELARHLAGSAPRTLNIQVDEALDGVAWEALGLGEERLADRFIVARQIVSESEPDAVVEAPPADALAVLLVHGGKALAAADAPVQALVQSLVQALAEAPAAVRAVAAPLLDDPRSREAVQAAHVLVLAGLGIDPVARALEALPPPRRARLIVLDRPEAAARLAPAVDHGAAVVALDAAGEEVEPARRELLRHLAAGASVGEAVRRLQRSHGPHGPQGPHRPHEPPSGEAAARGDARLYGDPALRFVRAPSPTSRRQVTSLSFDLVGSTTALRELGDEAYAEMLASLHARCTAVVRRHGGKPDDPQGDDGVMCYFGHPAAVEDAAVHAVEAGLAIARTVSELHVSVRVGIATGAVAVRDDQPVGLSIHLAARLQQAAAPGTVLIAAATRRLVAHAFELEPLATRPELKGIEATEPLYRVLGPSAGAGSDRLERLPWLTPLVGRQAELARLDAAWSETREGLCRLVVVQAEAGMGKSRLVREFRHRLAGAGVRILECRCRADASASAFLTLAEALKRWLGIGADETGAAAIGKLAAALPEPARSGEPLALLTALLGLAPQLPPAGPAGPPGQAALRLRNLLVDWFTAIAQDEPCCLVVEDWHWVDPSMREFVEHLAGRKGGPGLLVVLTARTEAPGVPARFAHPEWIERIERIELAGLDPEAARELVSLVCANALLPAGLVHRLATRGDGVPLFLEEAARLALELGVDRPEAGVVALETVPASLQDLLMARLDSLGFAKPVAQVAAVLGRDFPLELLAALLKSGRFALDATTLAEQLKVLEDSGLVRAEGNGLYAFRHALIRDTAYASLWARDRQALHARVVALLRESWPELAERRPELLALHQTEAGQYRDALAQWELAARNATARSAELEAISHLRHALAVLAHLEPGVERDRTALRLQLLLAARLIATEGYGAESVLQAYREAARLCEDIGDEASRFKVEMGLEAYRFMRADFALALEHARKAAAIAARSGDVRQRLHAHWGLACTLFHQGALRATMREMDAGLALYTPALHRLFGVQDPGVMCMAYSSWGLWELGRPDAAKARIDHAIAMAAEFEHKFSQAVALAYGVSILLLRGETEAALARADQCIRVCEDAGFPVWLAITRCMRGRLLCEQGDFGPGLSEMKAGYQQWLSTGSMVSRPLYLSLQAEGSILAGHLDGAQACVDEGLAVVERTGERQLESELRRLAGELALARGDAAAAESSLRQACVVALRQRRLGFALRAATSFAKLMAGDGRQARARKLLLPLLARWHEGRSTRDVQRAQALADSLA
ncbi:MAG: AAA family ATPase [Rubrivivax sp.]|nr:AAA family ATPase [Rubrivivax sp.]